MVPNTNKFFWTVVSIPVVLALILIGLIFAREASENRKLAAKLSQLRSRGFAVEDVGLAKQYTANTSIEAALAWEVVFQQLHGFSSDYDLLWDTNIDKAGDALLQKFESNPGSVETSRTFLKKYAKPYQKIVSCSHFSDPPQFIKKIDGLRTLLPHCSQMRSAARLVKLHGLMAVHDRDPDAVLTDVLTLINSADAISSGPTLLEQLVACSFHGSAHDLIKASIERNVLAAPQLTRLLKILVEHSEIGAGWHRGLSSELAAVLPVFSNPDAREFAIQGSSNNWLAYLPLRSADANLYIDLVEQALAMPTDDLGKLKAELSKLSLRQAALKQASFLQRMDSALTSELTPDMAKVGERFIETAVQHRMCAIGVAIRLHEFEMGQLPISLESLKKFGVDCTKLKPAVAESFGYDQALPIQLWNPDSTNRPAYSGLSREELNEYLNNLGPDDWRFTPSPIPAAELEVLPSG